MFFREWTHWKKLAVISGVCAGVWFFLLRSEPAPGLPQYTEQEKQAARDRVRDIIDPNSKEFRELQGQVNDAASKATIGEATVATSLGEAMPNGKLALHVSIKGRVKVDELAFLKRLPPQARHVPVIVALTVYERGDNGALRIRNEGVTQSGPGGEFNIQTEVRDWQPGMHVAVLRAAPDNRELAAVSFQVLEDGTSFVQSPDTPP